MKPLLNNLLRYGLSAVLLGWLYTKIDIEQTARVVKSADLKYIFMALLCFFLINVILIFRWFVYIKAMDLKVPVGSAVRYYLVGLFGNLFLPSAIGGDVIKIVGLCHNSDEKPKVVATVLLDRLSGFAGMVVVATIAGIAGLALRLLDDPKIFIMIGVMAAASFSVGFILLHKGVYSFFSRVFSKLPKFQSALMRMHDDIALLKGRTFAVYQAVGLSALSQLVLAVTFFLIARALHQEVALFYCVIFIPLVCVIAALPSIGGLGVREAGTAYFFGKVGVATGIAVSISLINFLFMAVVGLLGGLYYVLTQGPDAAAAKPAQI